MSSESKTPHYTNNSTTDFKIKSFTGSIAGSLIIILMWIFFFRSAVGLALSGRTMIRSRGAMYNNNNSALLLSSTTRKLADTLVQCAVDGGSSNVVVLPRPPPPLLRVCIAVAGGGGTAISTLASTPGASKLLIEGRILYDQRSFEHFLKQPLLTSTSFCSKEAAISLAKAALLSGIDLTPRISDRAACIGLGCTSVLVSNTPHKGQHRCHIALATSTYGDSYKLYSCILTKTPIVNVCDDDSDQTKTTTQQKQRPRTRIEEEEIVSSIVLYALLKHFKHNYHGDNHALRIDEALSMLHDNTVLMDGEDIFLEEEVDAVDDSKPTPIMNAVQYIIKNTVQRQEDKNIVSTPSSCILLVPKLVDNEVVTLVPMVLPTALPSSVIVFPGSFNPPHEGHMVLTRAAVNSCQQHHLMDSSGSATPSVIFEMSITNADKPVMEEKEVIRRINLFCSSCSHLNMPEDWSILLTASPLFSQKVALLDSVVGNNNYITNNHVDNNDCAKSRMIFVIGTDTLVRLLNPKYYDNNVSYMLKAIRDMKHKGVHFVVGGRVEQAQQSRVFVSGKEQLESMPVDVKNMFTLLSEEEFRVDISSTEIRNKQKDT